MTGIRFSALGAAGITPTALLGPARRHPEVEVVVLASRSLRRARAMARRGGRAVNNGESPPTDAGDSVRQLRLVDAVYRAEGLRVRGG